jgi:nucleoside-diphosphate-sugar epimerase
MKAYVTGATGCVGRNLVDELLKDGWEVVALHRNSSDLSRLPEGKDRKEQWAKGLDAREAYFYDKDSLRWAINTNADALFHCAGNTSYWNREAKIQYRDNVEVTRNLVEVALERGISRFIHTSTGAVAEVETPPPSGRLVAAAPSSYEWTKYLAEKEVRNGIQKGLNAVILRPIIVVGKYDWNNYSTIFSYLKNSKHKFAFPGSITFCHAADVARGHIQAFYHGQNRDVYYLSGEYATWQSMFSKVAKLVGVNDPIPVLPAWAMDVAATFLEAKSFFTGKKPLFTRELVSLLNDGKEVSDYEKTKTEKDLGYKSRDLDTMLKDCYDWLVAEGRL